MILRYGNYAHPVNEAQVFIDREQLPNEASQTTGYKEFWRIKGIKQAADHASLTTALAALEQAYFYNGQDIGLYLDDGVTPTNHILRTANTFGGIKVSKPVYYPMGDGGEYTTYRNYEIMIEAEMRLSASAVRLESWSESLSFQGTGGPLFRYLPTLTGQWQKQKVTDTSNYFVTQRGQAVGKSSYPTPRGPIWPDAEHVEQRVIDYQSADRNGGQLENYPVSWSYSFESNQALSGQPAQWP